MKNNGQNCVKSRGYISDWQLLILIADILVFTQTVMYIKLRRFHRYADVQCAYKRVVLRLTHERDWHWCCTQLSNNQTVAWSSCFNVSSYMSTTRFTLLQLQLPRPLTYSETLRSTAVSDTSIINKTWFTVQAHPEVSNGRLKNDQPACTE